MGQAEKTLAKMRNNPRDWQIDDLKTVAGRFDAEWRQHGSHVFFRFPNGEKLSVPASRPVKPVYVKEFVAIIDQLGGE